MGLYGESDIFAGVEFTCAVCGKTGYRSISWAYKKEVKHKNSYMCSWTCFRKFEEMHPTKFCNYAMSERKRKQAE